MKVRIVPDGNDDDTAVSQVARAYVKHLPKYGVQFVGRDASYDVKAAHAGITGGDCTVAILHGLYWTADYPASNMEYHVNSNIVQAVRSAKCITVPSPWVAEVFQRDMRINPYVVPHGIDHSQWINTYTRGDYILWNKNRISDVCDPNPLGVIAARLRDKFFVSTYSPDTSFPNIKVVGTMVHSEMKKIVQQAGVYLSTVKETFCLGALEALASGIPVAGFDYGGNHYLVHHGLDGYLAKPGDYDDLARGIEYCLKNKVTLGKNAMELSKQWTWERAVDKLYHVFEESLKEIPLSVSVIIPCYNYADKVGRAIESAINQEFKPSEIIVVDDGSSDNCSDVVSRYIGTNPNITVKYIKQANLGVANARNTGVSISSGKYICCLDADDKIEPLFLKRCVYAMETDKSISIGYTKLAFISRDGKTGVSDWPTEYDYNNQLQKHNQIPTCCVMKREVWERLGGQRQRYAPDGAGAEDGEFWLRTGAYGFKAKLITNEPLFTYTAGSGNTSRQGYKEVDWTTWHPWVTDNKHPFASLATAKRLGSHPVRQYDEPLISVVIPVGEKHENTVIDALDSLEAQTFRRWEAVVVWDSPNSPAPELLKAYPYIRLFYTKSPKSGAGKARNIGASNSRGNFLVFLDADDYLIPNAFERMITEWQYGESIIYSDYFGISTIAETDLSNYKDRIIDYRPKNQQALIRYNSQNYDCILAQKQPIIDHIYHWCLVTCLIPKVWHDEIGGFDEDMLSWEDVDYHWRMAQAGKCYTRIAEPLMVYRFDTGNRRIFASSDNNASVGSELLGYMHEKYKGVKNMTPCHTCGQQKSVGVSQQAQQDYEKMIQIMSGNVQTGEKMSDNEFVEVIYTHPNRGDHMVSRQPSGIDYGMRAGGDRFLVHIKDVEGSPHLFRKITDVVSGVNVPKQVVKEIVEDPVDLSQTLGEEKMSALLSKLMGRDNMSEVPKELSSTVEKFDLQRLAGVTANIAEQLMQAGIDTPQGIVDFGITAVLALKGVGDKRANLIMRSSKIAVGIKVEDD